jgi:hypothetical protein
MCTATWLIHERGYELFFNRDERRTRKPALPPRVHELNGVRCLAPVDGNFGGSWLAVNEFGLTLGLLNWYEGEVCSEARSASGLPPHAASLRSSLRTSASRGLLLLSLMDQRSPDEIARLLWQRKPSDYPPFLLLILAPKLAPMLLKWDGDRITSDLQPSLPVTTSSFDTANVLRVRREQFQSLKHSDTEAHIRYHHSRNLKGDAYSVCMSRPDAITVSFSRVTVTRERVEFFYQPRRSDCIFGEPSLATMPLRVSP